MNRYDVVNKALSYVKEDKYSNPNKFTIWYFKNNLAHAWCGVFIDYVIKHDLECNWLDSCSNFAYVPTIVEWAKKMGYWDTDYTKAKKGDLVAFNFDLKKPDHLSHVGIVNELIGDGLNTVEGNTSNNKYGSDCVAIKNRNKKNIVGIIKLPYEEDPMDIKEGDYVYALDNIKLYTTIEYKESKYTLKKGQKTYVRRIKADNIALADDITHEYYPSAWTKEVKNLSKTDPTDYKKLYEEEKALNKILQDRINEAIKVLNG